MSIYPEEFDVIVVGGGHAGCEAALSTSRMGCKTLLLTMNLDTIGQMSCNPAIGGIAKGQMVREIDALGGVMGKIADKSAIQYRCLNRSKGPAVWSPRAQCDRTFYKIFMKQLIENQKNLVVQQQEVTRILVGDNSVCGVETKTGIVYKSKIVILTTGTFLNGLIHIGLKNFPGGRYSEAPSVGITESLKSLGFEVGRLKTGTPPRINSQTVDYTKLEIQYGDEEPIFFSHSKFPQDSLLTTVLQGKQLPCWITYTNETTHKIILDNLDRSPLYTGVIKGIGPRYCPSIEDKVVKFKDKPRHQVFLEPEGVYTQEIYCNGISTSLPQDVQEKIVKSLPGCEHAQIVRYGYAVEYDFCQPTQLYHTLETKLVEGLYFAGQINGTTGYEEAAAQGLIAGINAVLKLRKEEPFILRRDEAYIGVLIDDLVTKGVLDPYRMFTSRAEFRLLLRTDNADLRLMDYGYKFGLINETQYREFCKYRDKLTNFISFLEINKPFNTNTTFATILRQGEKIENLITEIKSQYSVDLEQKNTYWDEQKLAKEAEIQIKYSGYIQRQLKEVEKLKKLEKKKIPEDIDYTKIPGLLKEAQIKLAQIKPKTIGQAMRISGVTPSDIAILMVYIKHLQEKKV